MPLALARADKQGRGHHSLRDVATLPLWEASPREMPFCKTRGFIKTSYEHRVGSQRRQAEAAGLSLLAEATPVLAQHWHAPTSGSGGAVVCPIRDPAGMTGGVRDLSMWLEEAKVSPATGLPSDSHEAEQAAKSWA